MERANATTANIKMITMNECNLDSTHYSRTIIGYGDKAEKIEVGTITTIRETHKITITDIYIASQFRGRGIGTELCELIQINARELNLPIEVVLPAKKRDELQVFFQRLGFEPDTENIYSSLYIVLRWQP